MATVTISLPDHITRRVDVEVKQQGFATRSEFVRSLIRKYFGAGELTFEPFISRPLEEIEEELRKTGKYNEQFIKSVINGLRDNSSFYEGKTA